MAGNVIIKKVNEVYLRIDCEPSIAFELRDHFTFEVPGAKFSPAYKSRMWDGKIRLFDIRTHTIYSGLLDKVLEFLTGENYAYTLDFRTSEAVDPSWLDQYVKDLQLPYSAYEHQMHAVLYALKNQRTLLVSPTASGKSMIIYTLARIFTDAGMKGLIIVPTVQLVSQLKKDFADYAVNISWDADEHVHEIYSGKEKITNKSITISTWQSIYKNDANFFKGYDFVIGDEAHSFKAKSLISIMTKLVNAKYRIGTTGTLDGMKTNELTLTGLFGPPEKVITTKQLMEKKQVAQFSIKCLCIKHPELYRKHLKNATYQEEIDYLVSSVERTKIICSIALATKGNTLVLYQLVDKHGKQIFDMLKEMNNYSGKQFFFISGATKLDDREDIRALVERQDNVVIVASVGTTSTGINMVNLRNIIFASPSKSRIRVLQSIGRALRKSDMKQEAKLYDIADDLSWKSHKNYTLKHFIERMKIYSSEHLEFKLHEINLKDNE